MARVLTAGMQTAVAAESHAVVHLIELQFAGGTVRYCTATQDITTTVPAATWVAIGGALEISVVEEGIDLSGQAVEVTFSGVDQAVITLLLGDKYLGRRCKIYWAHVDEAAGTVVADPLLVFNGLMNGPFRIQEQRDERGEQTGSVKITTRFSDPFGALEQGRGIRTNVESHQSFFSGDSFFAFAPVMVERRLHWGDTAAWSPGSGPREINRTRGVVGVIARAKRRSGGL